MVHEKVKVYYISDPICSHCWGLEPQLNRFFAQYGDYMDLHVLMGGILPSWKTFPGDERNGIYEEKDTIEHWREYAETSGMPIDGSLMQDDPVASSFPASQVFKKLQEKDTKKANLFLRSVREAVFVQNQNISDAFVLSKLIDPGVVSQALTKDYEAKVWVDREKMKSLGAFVTPALIFINKDGKKVRKVGNFSVREYEKALKRALRVTELKPKPVPSLRDWLKEQPIIFAKEIAVMYDLPLAFVQRFVARELGTDAYTLHLFRGTFYIKEN
ncbi:DsbA family protein [Jeotgalibaca sp. A122]|uniref:DsbA family protein n=1 Tax=Jeotgalibaca sp. A122 TaxID=3457322 RepID=UPI003FD21B95